MCCRYDVLMMLVQDDVEQVLADDWWLGDVPGVTFGDVLSLLYPWSVSSSGFSRVFSICIILKLRMDVLDIFLDIFICFVHDLNQFRFAFVNTGEDLTGWDINSSVLIGLLIHHVM